MGSSHRQTREAGSHADRGQVRLDAVRPPEQEGSGLGPFTLLSGGRSPLGHAAVTGEGREDPEEARRGGRLGARP